MARGDANIVISAQDKTAQAFAAVEARLSKLGGVASGAARMLGPVGLAVTATAAALVTSTKRFADYADEIGKASQKIGTTTETLSELKYAGDLADVTFEQLQTGLGKLAKTAGDFKNGSESAVAAFDSIGVDPSKFNDTGDLLKVIAERFKQMEDSANKTRLAQELFGKSGKELIPLLNEGAAGLKKAADEAKAFGLVVDRDAAKNAELFNDSLTRLEKAGGGLANTIGAKLLPPLAQLTEYLSTASIAGEGFFGSLAAFVTREQDIDQSIKSIEDRLVSLKKTRDALSKDTISNKVNDFVFGDVADLNIQIRVAEQELKSLKSKRDSIASVKKQQSEPSNIAKTAEIETLAFDELSKGLSLASVKLGELTEKQAQASASFKAGTITLQEYQEITAAINKQRADTLNKKSGRTGKSDAEKDAEAAARFVESLKKQADTADYAKSQLIAYDAAQLKLTESQKAFVAAVVADEKAKEAQIAINERWQESQERTRQLTEEEVALVIQRQQSYDDMADELTRINEDLNVDLIESDKERVKAQIELEHQRAIERIEGMQLEAEQVEDLLAKEQERYEKVLQKSARDIKSTKSLSEDLGLVFKSAFEEGIRSGDDFGDTLGNLGKDIEQLATRRLVLEPLLSAFDQLIDKMKESSSFSGAGSAFSDIGGSVLDGVFDFFFNAKGGVYNSPSLSKYSGKVYDSPQLFKFANGAGVFGEAGPEAIMPLKRGADGKLGVAASGTGGGNVTVNVYGTQGQPEVRTRDDGNGQMTIDLIFDAVKANLSRDIRSEGVFAQTLQGQYGLNRAFGAR